MYIGILINSLLAVLLFLIQKSFISGLPMPFSAVNPAIVAIVFILVFKDLKFALYWSLGVGFLLDIYSFLPFGTFIVDLSITFFLTNFLLTNFLTNRSLYSFLFLTMFATLSYEILLVILVFIYNFFSDATLGGSMTFDLLMNGLKGLGLNLLAVALIFYLLGFLSKNLKPVFLIRRK